MVINMYIDVALIDEFDKKYGKILTSSLEVLLLRCGIWFSANGIRAEQENFDLTLEEIFSEYYFIVDENTIKFASPEQLWEDMEEYLSL